MKLTWTRLTRLFVNEVVSIRRLNDLLGTKNYNLKKHVDGTGFTLKRTIQKAGKIFDTDDH